jgi:hypothetical protein
MTSSRKKSSCCKLESGAEESQSQMAHALCFWQAAVWLVLYDEKGDVTHTTPEGVFARVGDSWWMVPPRAPNVEGQVGRTHYSTDRNHSHSHGDDDDSDGGRGGGGSGGGGSGGGGDGGGGGGRTDPTADGAEIVCDATSGNDKLPPRPSRTMEALGLLLAVLATPTERPGDVPGYVRAGGMGLLWNLAGRVGCHRFSFTLIVVRQNTVQLMTASMAHVTTNLSPPGSECNNPSRVTAV